MKIKTYKTDLRAMHRYAKEWNPNAIVWDFYVMLLNSNAMVYVEKDMVELTVPNASTLLANANHYGI